MIERQKEQNYTERAFFHLGESLSYLALYATRGNMWSDMIVPSALPISATLSSAPGGPSTRQRKRVGEWISQKSSRIVEFFRRAKTVTTGEEAGRKGTVPAFGFKKKNKYF